MSGETPPQDSEFYRQFLNLFCTVEYQTDGLTRIAKGVLKSVNGTKIFVKGDYKLFFIDMSQIIHISGKEDINQK